MLLKLQNIGKIYNSNDILTIGIRGINLELDYNEFVTIEGESGSGKSTLLNVIGANDSYEEGELYINGMETSHYSESEWEKYREQYIATIFQDFNIIENLTVIENVELALLRIEDGKERRRIAKELIEKVGLTKQADRKGSKLSGGEKQRTVIARALAKDSPIILADEPTGNLDVKASKEVAKLLKDVSKDKLVIVVTHNPEFFKEYATRRISVFDGAIKEDRTEIKPAPLSSDKTQEETVFTKKQNLKNVLWLGVLNYKSRPHFTLLMTFALFVCAITVFILLSLFGQSLIKPLTTTIDEQAVEGKVIVTGSGETIDAESLDEVAGRTGAGFILADKDYSSFEIEIPKSRGMLSAYTITCMYAPYLHNLNAGEAVLVMPVSCGKDEEVIKSIFLDSGVGIANIDVKKVMNINSVTLYLSYSDIVNNGVKIRSVNSEMKLGEDTARAFAFRVNNEIESGEIRLLNSTFWNVKGLTAVLSIKSNRAYLIADDNGKDESVSGIVVEMNADDYASIFSKEITEGKQGCLYFSSEAKAEQAIKNLPDGYMGLMSTSKVYVLGSGDIYTQNVALYLALIAISFCFSMIMSIIFMRSIKVFQADFTIYKTLGIPKKVSSKSLYIQMLLIFLPTLVLLPIVSLIACVIPGSGMILISIGNYFFIEILMLLIVELVAFGFNRGINRSSIRKNLKRGSK